MCGSKENGQRRAGEGLSDHECGYALDPAQVPHYLDALAPPTVSGDEGGGWTVRLVTLSGWMHELQTLARHEITISDSHEVSVSSTTLSTAVFSEIPPIVY